MSPGVFLGGLFISAVPKSIPLVRTYQSLLQFNGSIARTDEKPYYVMGRYAVPGHAASFSLVCM